MASGSMNFHAKRSSWSQRKRGRVQRTRIWKLQSSSTFTRKVTTCMSTTQPWPMATTCAAGQHEARVDIHGRLQPPRKSVTNSAATIAISTNSASMNMPCFIALYSVK